MTFVFLAWKVEGVSYLDTSGETNVNRKDQTLDQVASVDHLEESMKFSDSSATKGMQSIEATDESTAKLKNKSVDECNTDPTSDETDNHHVEVPLKYMEHLKAFLAAIIIYLGVILTKAVLFEVILEEAFGVLLKETPL